MAHVQLHQNAGHITGPVKQAQQSSFAQIKQHSSSYKSSNQAAYQLDQAGDPDDPSCISFSENIDESPNKNVPSAEEKVVDHQPSDQAGTHFKIYEFNYNEQKIQKSAMSSTDRSARGGTPFTVAHGQQPQLEPVCQKS